MRGFSETLPMTVTDEQVAGALTAVATQPKAHWSELVAALGLDGTPVLSKHPFSAHRRNI